MEIYYAEKVSKTYSKLTLDELIKVLKALEEAGFDGYVCDDVKIIRCSDEYGLFLGYYAISLSSSVGGIKDLDSLIHFLTTGKEDLDGISKEIAP